MSLDHIVREEIRAWVKEAIEEIKAIEGPILLSREQAARLLGCSPRQVDNLREMGVIAPVRFPAKDGKGPDGHPKYLRADLIEAAKRHKIVKE